MTTQHEFWKSTTLTSVGTETFETFTQSHRANGLLTLYAAAHHASQRVLQDLRGEILTIDGCGGRRLESFAHYDQELQSWKTRQACFFSSKNLAGLSGSWPRSGICLNGECFHLPEWEQIIVEKGCSFMPTPTAGTPPKNGLRWDDNGGSYARKMLLKFMSLEEIKQHRNPEYLEWQMGFPIKYTAVEDSEIVATQESPNGSGAES